MPTMLLMLAMLSSASSASAAAAVHYYTVSIDYALDRLSVEAVFAHPVASVSARSRSAGKYLLDVRGCGEDADIKLRNRRLMLPEHGIRCLNYTVDLGRAASEYRSSRNLDPRNIVVSPAFWLWRPELFSDTTIRVDFRLPDAMKVSVPWQPAADDGMSFVLGKSPESAYAPAAFGAFDYREIEVPGAMLRVSVLTGKEDSDADSVFDWVQATATEVSLAYGRFPHPSPQVLVVPSRSGRSDSAVSFGQVIRDGGETVELYVDPSKPMSEFLADWKATHEFSHLMLPYLHAEHHWISEGFAQYYQNILLTRAGAYDHRQTWQNLYAGYERGRQSRPELSPNEATAGNVRSGRMKVYWSGAAIALMADVTLRERSNGEDSLDKVLSRFQSCCLPSDEVWSGPAFFTVLDSLASTPVFMPLYRRYADTAGFPDTSELLEKLGVMVDEGEVRLKRNAELQEVREAITKTDTVIARQRGQLAVN